MLSVWEGEPWIDRSGTVFDYEIETDPPVKRNLWSPSAVRAVGVHVGIFQVGKSRCEGKDY